MVPGRIRGRGIVLLALFVSGMAGLMHEVVWAKYLIDLMGNTAHSNAVVLTVFMGGLATGAVVFGRRADCWDRPLIAYAWLEVLIGLYALVLPFVIGAAGAAYEAAAARYFEQGTLKLVLRFGLSIAILSPPAILMGATLPVLAKSLVGEIARTRREVASLYAMNNLGAVVGSGVAGFVTLPLFGIIPSLVFATVANFAAAGLVLLVHRAAEAGHDLATRAESAPDAQQAGYGPLQYQATLVALAFSGFAAMGYEIVMLRVIALAFGSSTYSFTVMLMCFITGISVGSGLLTVMRPRRPLFLLGASQLAVVVSLILVTPLMERMPYYMALMRTQLVDDALGFELYQLAKASLCLGVLLVPTICIGISFPLVTHVQARSLRSIGSTVGSTYAWNTAGNVLGVLVTSLALLPAFGIRGSFEINLVLSAVAGVLILVAAAEVHLVARVAAVAVAAAAALLYASGLRSWPDAINHATNHLRLREPAPDYLTPEQFAAYPTSSFAAWKDTFVVDFENLSPRFFREDENNTVLAFESDGGIELFVNTKGDASTHLGDLINQVLLGHVPMFVVPEASTTLVIGHGSGITSGSSMRHPQERMDIVEISRGVMAADPLFAPYNYHVLDDPRSHVYVEDARTFLRTVPRTYDAIVSVPSNPWIAGIGSLFSREFFRDARQRLNDGGVLCMWFHQYEQSDEGCRLVLRTLGSVFDDVVIFHSFASPHSQEPDVMAIASNGPLRPDFAAMEARFDTPAVRADLARIGILNLATLLSYNAVSPSRFATFQDDGPINTDDHQRLQYNAPRDHFRDSTATVVSQYEGFAPAPDGLTDGWLDRYLAWRAEQGEPVSREELVIAARNLALSMTGAQELDPFLAAERNRLVRHLVARLDAATSREGAPPASPARGGTPPVEELVFSEALQRAMAYVLAGRPELSLPLFEHVVDLQPGNRAASQEYVAALAATGRFAEAAAELERLLGVLPDRRGALTALQLERATYLRQAGSLAAAEAVLAELAPTTRDAKVHVELAVTRVQLGRLAEAEQSFRRAVELNPRGYEAIEALALLLAGQPDRGADALAVVDQALRTMPERRELRALRDEIAAMQQ